MLSDMIQYSMEKCAGVVYKKGLPEPKAVSHGAHVNQTLADLAEWSRKPNAPLIFQSSTGMSPFNAADELIRNGHGGIQFGHPFGLSLKGPDPSAAEARQMHGWVQEHRKAWNLRKARAQEAASQGPIRKTVNKLTKKTPQMPKYPTLHFI
jgi:hypothetical protein